MHAQCTLHSRSLDNTRYPNEKTLKEFRFLDINTALVNAMEAMSNQPHP
jgi:hypothetical protein